MCSQMWASFTGEVQRETKVLLWDYMMSLVFVFLQDLIIQDSEGCWNYFKIEQVAH